LFLASGPLLRGVVCFLVLLAQISGQARPGFEVASVKQAKGEGHFRGGCNGIDSNIPPEHLASAPPLGRCVITSASLDQMLAVAYELRFMELIKGGPRWAREDGLRFDLEAKVEDSAGATSAQLYRMLQALLVERFKIKLRTETEDVPGLALVVAKGGSKLQQSKGDELPYFKVVSGHPMTLSARKYPMATFAAFLDLRRLSNGPVVDKTGLAGTYDFTLSWDEQEGPSLVTALHELGLQLDARKVPASFLVIESAERPAEN
jgi:uncharacterized protein (TIGR03435 family)